MTRRLREASSCLRAAVEVVSLVVQVSSGVLLLVTSAAERCIVLEVTWRHLDPWRLRPYGRELVYHTGQQEWCCLIEGLLACEMLRQSA